MAATGFVLFAAEAAHLAENSVFQLKMVLIGAGLLNAAAYEFRLRGRINALSNGAPIPPRAKIAGLLSIGIWIAVAACGRSIAYF
jgi:hypothetical protein